MKEPPEIYLVDNGSLRPEASLALRSLAEALSLRSGCEVQPVSLLHSHKVPESQMGGRPATIVRRAIKAAIASGKRSFVIVPLFLGPSRAIVDYLPELIESFRANTPDLNVCIAAPLAGDDPQLPDRRLAEIIADQVKDFGDVRMHDLQVALVDHGTPAPAVNCLRNAVAAQLAEILSVPVLPCSMERRDGAQYDFNEPLLERIGKIAVGGSGDLVLAMFFLLPGRHAGAGGDVAEICQGLLDAGQFRRIRQTPLLGSHLKIVEILNDRLAAVLTTEFRCP